MAARLFSLGILCLGLFVGPLEAAINLTTAAIPSASGTGAIGGDFIANNGTIEGASGTGLFNAFLRMQQAGSGNNAETSEHAYNGDFDFVLDGKSGHTKLITIGDLTAVNIGTESYFEFLLDIGENGGPTSPSRLLTLNQLQIFTGDNGPSKNGVVNPNPAQVNVSPVLSFDGSEGLAEKFRLNPSGSLANAIDLNAGLVGGGNGNTDMYFYVNTDAFAGLDGDTKVVLYSHFGTLPGTYESDGTFEEWGVRVKDGDTDPDPVPEPTVPEPTTLAIWGLGLGIAGLVKLRRKKLTA